ncbi:phosphatidylglycerol lysyltransferase domain-containing protein [uncultured Paracoccus sp.]|uniref:phosphatidylglycerol lysyltransferase domain-containing protein n=1 Tax=uncultured Paracoccus sp. TaxID=189685 RepID=UPI00263027FE|nr:phosphatidylglycerol lysyltransferase domain-containing protein [uncultured Paracoccus sp.]
MTGGDRLVFETAGRAILVYRLSRKPDGVRLSLLVPPFPFDAAALDHAGARMEAVNADRRQRILRVPDAAAWQVAREGFSLRFNTDEYIYDAEDVTRMSGSPYASLRRKIGRYRSTDLTARPYRQTDRPECEALLEAWQLGLKRRGISIGPYRAYTRLCLACADISPEVLRGEVIRVDGAVAAFTFGGPINAQMSSMFITVSDHAQPGLAYLQRQRFIAGDAGSTPLFNDFCDSKRPGMAQMKRSFRPVAMHSLFNAARG